jgi:uncharacterized membrane protein
MLHVLTFISALGCGLAAGVFFAFSTFVMRALGSLSPAQGIAAMQSINVFAINPWFMTALFGTAATCIAVIILALARSHSPGALYLIVGSLFYVIGAILVTMVFNVPRNNALAAIAPSSAEGARLWADYLREWTSWNHVRTVAAFAGAAALTVGLCR